MSHRTLRILACFALAFPPFTIVSLAEAGVRGASVADSSSFQRFLPVETVQAGECWKENGPDGPGYYPCGDGGVGSFVGPGIRRDRREGVGRPSVLNPANPAALSGRVGAGGVPASAAPRVGAAPGLAGVHGAGGATGGRIGAPASPGIIPVAGLHGIAGAAATPHIGALAAPAHAGVGAVPAAGASLGASHIGAPAAPGLGGGIHAPAGGGGAFHGAGVGGHR